MRRLFTWLRRLGLVALILVLFLGITGPFWISYLGGNYDGTPAGLLTGLRGEDGELEGNDELSVLMRRTMLDLEPTRLVDMHVHLLGLGTSGSGCYVNPRLLSPLFPLDYVRFKVYQSAARIGDLKRADQLYIRRLQDLVQHSPVPSRYMLLAFDEHYQEDGTVHAGSTEFHVPDQYAFDAAAGKDAFLPAISVHPYRSDSLEVLERGAERGARVVKWLPNAMGIDPLSRLCHDDYDKMRELGLILLSHSGEEKAVHAEEYQEFGNPLRLRAALDRGVTVVVGHCASTGDGLDLDRGDNSTQTCFDLFLRMMGEERYEGLLFGELSAVTQVNRYGRALRTLLDRKDLHPRLVNGSDYPLPGVNCLFQTRALTREGFLSEDERRVLNRIYRHNPLLFDLALKRCLRHPATGARFAPEAFLVPESWGL